MKWFRWYRGTAERAKFRIIAKRAGVNVTDAIAIWVVLLEDAGNASHWRYVTRYVTDVATMLDISTKLVESVIQAMIDEEMLARVEDDGRLEVVNWNKYQYVSDSDPTRNERQKRYRNKRVSNALHNAPITRTESDTESENNSSTDLAFSGQVIRLTNAQYNLWKKTFHHLDLDAYLLARDIYLASPEGAASRARWFVATASDLRNKHDKAKPKLKVYQGVSPTKRTWAEIQEEKKNAMVRGNDQVKEGSISTATAKSAGI